MRGGSVVLLGLAGLLLGCHSLNEGSREAQPEQACDCKCTAAGPTSAAAPSNSAAPSSTAAPSSAAGSAAPAGTVAAPVVAAGSPADLARKASDALVSANRKMTHGDGAGCLADLDVARAIDPVLEGHMSVVRAQCEMLIGQCQAGKTRVKNYYLEETRLGPDQAERMAESIASMHCRGGDSSDRDRFLVAAQQLTEAAYMEKKAPAYCRERIAVLRELDTKVPARQFDDGQVSGTKQALFYTAAACYARAGDCQAAFAIYSELFPQQGFGPGVDAAARQAVIRSSFDSSIERCRP